MAVPSRTRRSPVELRTLVLEAAGRVFDREAYADVTIESIAAEAGVTRSVLYRHFDNKEELFRATVLAPFVDSIRQYAEVWQSQADQPWDAESLMRAMATVFYDAFAAHRGALLAIAGQGSQGPLDHSIRAALDEFFDQIVAIGEKDIENRPWIPREGLELSIRLVIGAIAAAAVLDPVIFPPEAGRPSREAIIDRLTALTVYGLSLSTERPST